MKGNKEFQNTWLKGQNVGHKELEKTERGNSSKNRKFRSSSKSRSSSNLRMGSEEKKSENSNCDVTFLRKLLAMNKKEELILNKKLARLMLEEEFGKPDEEPKHENNRNTYKNLFYKNKKDLSFDTKKERCRSTVVENKLTRDKYRLRSLGPSKMNIPPTLTRSQYDLNGRRIYYDSDICDESEDEEISIHKYNYSRIEEADPKRSAKISSDISKTYHFKTGTSLKTKSDITCEALVKGNLSSKRISLTDVSQAVLERKDLEGRNIKEDQAEDESKLKKCLFTRTASLVSKEPSQEIVEIDPGDGVRNLIVHCCEVANNKVSNETKKPVFKVWNFNNIPKVKPSNCETSGNLCADKEGDMIKLVVKGENDSKIEEEEKSIQIYNKIGSHERNNES